MATEEDFAGRDKPLLYSPVEGVDAAREVRRSAFLAFVSDQGLDYALQNVAQLTPDEISAGVTLDDAYDQIADLIPV